MPFVFTNVKEKTDFIKNLKARSLSCASYLNPTLAGQDTASQPAAALPFNPLLTTFSFDFDCWIPTVSLSVAMDEASETQIADGFSRQMLALTLTPNPLTNGISSSTAASPENEIASMLTGWTEFLNSSPSSTQLGAADGYGTTVFRLTPNGVYIPAKKPIYLFFYSLSADDASTPNFVLKAAVYYIPIPG